MEHRIDTILAKPVAHREPRPDPPPAVATPEAKEASAKRTPHEEWQRPDGALPDGGDAEC